MDSNDGTYSPEASTLKPQSFDPGQLAKRQAEEKEFIRQHDSSEALIWFLIDVNWLQAWKTFVTRGGALPGPIDNNRLVDRSTGQPKVGLRAVDDYRGVNGEIWNFWLQRYGGGPTIRRRQLDLYQPEEEEEEFLVGSTPKRRSQLQQQQQTSQQSRTQQMPSRPSPSSSSTSTPPPPQAASPVIAPGTAAAAATPKKNGFFSIGSRSSTQPLGKTQATKPGGANGASKDAASSEAATPAAKKLCCDKCDGPHETENCPHFKKARDKHPDAWTGYGKTTRVSESEGDGAPVVRNARVIQQPGDGSCLFHSLCYGLADSSSASELRRDICRYIRRNPDMTIAETPIEDWIKYDSNDTVAQYANRMEGNVWGGAIEMAALMKMKNVNVHVYEKCREGYRRISAFDTPGARKTVSVLYQGRMHYDAIQI